MQNINSFFKKKIKLTTITKNQYKGHRPLSVNYKPREGKNLPLDRLRTRGGVGSRDVSLPLRNLK